MRTLLLLRGAAGCGKSTWIKDNGLKPYTLSADDIRCMYQSPALQTDGRTEIPQNHGTPVWKTLFRILEERMKRGDFTVIDATNYKISGMKQYKELCRTYRYRIYCADFTDIPIDEVKRRNALRKDFRRVPEEVIDNMYSYFAAQKIPSGIKIIKPEELASIWLKCLDFSSYDRIHHIGDIHGCYTALMKYLEDNGGIKENEFYIFIGDYIDRGLENAEVVKFLLSIRDKPNVLLLEGNHERYLKLWSENSSVRSEKENHETKEQLDNSDISRKEVKCLYRRLGQCAYYRYDDKIFLVTHGGLSRISENLTFVSTEQLISGTGEYGDAEKTDASFLKNTPSNVYQIHGHRNIQHLPVQVNDRTFNLEGQVEFGGYLRCVQVSHEAIRTVEIKNDVFRRPEPGIQAVPQTVSSLMEAMRKNPYINEKRFGNISSFNFSRNAFYRGVWDGQTVKARGLYIDTCKETIAARAYDKFFNINERPETTLPALSRTLKFPVTAYVKENGFLGIVSYNIYEKDLLITTKSSLDGDFAGWLKEMIYSKIDNDRLEQLRDYVKQHNVSFVFECVDMVHDPHIIEYPESNIYLLDIVYNDMTFRKYTYEEMCLTAQRFGFTPKERAYDIANWHDFYDWYTAVADENYEYNGRKIEGFVIEDSGGNMVKLKLAYYNFWKSMRGVARETLKKGSVRQQKIAAFDSLLAEDFYEWLKTLSVKKDIPTDICSLRNMYYQEKATA